MMWLSRFFTAADAIQTYTHARDDWNNTTFPAVPGHEIIGLVKSVGPDVTHFKQGDTVGVGCMVDSCQNCKACKTGFGTILDLLRN